MADPAGTEVPKVKKKREVKKRPLVVLYKGEGVEIVNVTRDLNAVVDALSGADGVKAYKLVI